MTEHLLLINAITLIYCSSLLENIDDYRPLIKKIVTPIKPSTAVMGDVSSAGTVGALRSTVLSMCTDNPNTKYDKNVLLQRIKVDSKDNPEIYDIVLESIGGSIEKNAAKSMCADLSRSLGVFQRNKEIDEAIQKAAYQTKFESDKILDRSTFLNDFLAKLEGMQVAVSEKKDPAILSAVSFLNVEQITESFNASDSENNGIGIMKTGYIAINRMLQGGFRPGEEVSVAALPHNYKTGFTLSLFRGMARHNTPVLIDPTKKPLLLRISFEDKLENNIDFLFRALKHNELKGRDYDYKAVSSEDKAKVVQSQMTENGFYIEMLRVDPTQWTYRHIINKCLEYEAAGYEIKLLMLDYLTMVPTTGCIEGAAGWDVRDMYRRMRNFANPRGIILITPHQLSTEAKMKKREGAAGFVKNMPDGGYYDRCKTVDNEVDIELFIDIEKYKGRSYLAVQRGKHRVNTVIGEEDKYCLLPFMFAGSILDDIVSGVDSSLPALGAKRANAHAETAGDDFNY
jgi:hypothetical protein